VCFFFDFISYFVVVGANDELDFAIEITKEEFKGKPDKVVLPAVYFFESLKKLAEEAIIHHKSLTRESVLINASLDQTTKFYTAMDLAARDIAEKEKAKKLRAEIKSFSNAVNAEKKNNPLLNTNPSDIINKGME